MKTNNKENRNEEMKRIIAGFTAGERPRLLLHACCAPCSSAVLERLSAFEVTPLFYNPNIDTQTEYALRASQLQKLYACQNLPYCVPPRVMPYDPAPFYAAVRGLESLPEGGARCEKCISLRLEFTADYAARYGYDCFCSTLSVSPHKNAALIHALGESLGQSYGIRYLPNDFKKENGYLRSIQLSSTYALYRQPYCGCRFGKTE